MTVSSNYFMEMLLEANAPTGPMDELIRLPTLIILAFNDYNSARRTFPWAVGRTI